MIELAFNAWSGGTRCGRLLDGRRIDTEGVLICHRHALRVVRGHSGYSRQRAGRVYSRRQVLVRQSR